MNGKSSTSSGGNNNGNKGGQSGSQSKGGSQSGGSQSRPGSSDDDSEPDASWSANSGTMTKSSSWLLKIENQYKVLFEENEDLMENEGVAEALADFQEQLELVQQSGDADKEGKREDLENAFEELKTALSEVSEELEAA